MNMGISLTLIRVMAGCALLSGARAWADEAEHRALAEEVLSLVDVQKNIEQSFEQVKKMQLSQLQRMNLSAGDATKARVAQEEVMQLIREEFTWEKVKDDYVQIYADTFTDEEMKGLIEFYKGPVGRKFIEKTPDLMKRSMAVSQKQMTAIMPKIQEVMKKAGASMQSVGPRLSPQPFSETPPPAGR
jgi:hypothetical protein